MSKQLPYEPEGIYHIYNHANGRENLFEVEENYNYFLRKYAEKLDNVVRTLAYCLMPNHFHLLIQVRPETALKSFLNTQKNKVKSFENVTPDNLCHFIVHRQFHNFLSGYAKAFNKFHNRSGSLLRQNTRRKMVSEENYLMNIIRYLHLNSVHHNFTVSPDDWLHSSYHAYLSYKPTRIPREEILNWFGGKERFIDFHLEKLNDGVNPEFEF